MAQMSAGEGWPVELPLEQRIELSRCLSDLYAISTSQLLFGGLLTNGTSDVPVEITDELAADLTRAAEENAARWRRMKDSAGFIVGLGPLVADQNIDLGLRAAGLHGSPVGETFLRKTQDEGGAAEFIRNRIGRIEPGFANELERAVELYAYWASWPRGRGADGQPSGIVSDFAASSWGCLAAMGTIAAGGVAVGVAGTALVLTGGASAGASAGLGLAGIAAVGVGAYLVGTYC